MGYSLWYIKIEPSQNQDLSTSLERSYEELLNAIISFEIRHSYNSNHGQSKKRPQNGKL